MGINLGLVKSQLGLVALVLHYILQQHPAVKFLDECRYQSIAHND